MSQYHKRIDGRTRQRINKTILSASDICHICGHPGADAVDHVIPLSKGGTEARSNKKPVHHDVACETCGHRCNRDKGAKLIAPVIKRSSSLSRPRGQAPSPTEPTDLRG